jgi:WD40 repeat protein
VGTLRLLDMDSDREGHAGEIYGVAFAPDGTTLLTGGWDGCLRLWDAGTGHPLASVQAAQKPLSACAWTVDGTRWLSGSMEGMLGIWDVANQGLLFEFLAHTRPISAFSFTPDGQGLVTASWDRQIVLRKVGREREGRTLAGHQDIVAGCRYAANGAHLLSWSHDRSLRLWDPNSGSEIGRLVGHEDRVTCAALSPDGRLAVSGGRDGELKVWDLATSSDLTTLALPAELCACFFLPDGCSVVAVDVEGLVSLLTAPELELQCEVGVCRKAFCADLSPASNLLALGCEDGRPAFLAIEGFDDTDLFVVATTGVKQKFSLLGRFLGKTTTTNVFQFICPVCRRQGELSVLPPRLDCPGCQRRLRLQTPPVLPLR